MKKEEYDDLCDRVRNPLNIIVLETEILRRSTGNSDVLKAMESIDAQVKRINEYIKSLYRKERTNEK